MAESGRKGLGIQKERQNSKTKNLVILEGDMASEEDLDGILRDVEKLKAKKNQARCSKTDTGKAKWKTEVEFTRQDEEDLAQIFKAAEKRKKDIEGLLGAAKNGGNDDSDDDDDASSSIKSTSSSDDSSDSDLDRPDDMENEDTLPTKTKGVSPQEKELDNEMDKILEEVKRTESKVKLKE